MQLPLDAVIVPDGAGCVAADVRYRGNPLEGAILRLEAPGGSAEAESNAFGKARACLPGAAPGQATAVATLAGVARSATYSCIAALCSITIAAPGGPGAPPAPVAPGDKPCIHHLKVRLKQVERRFARASATLTCGSATLTRLASRVYVRRRSGRLTPRLRTLNVTYEKTTAFTIRARLRPGDRLVLVAGSDASGTIPLLKRTALATRSLGARSAP